MCLVIPATFAQCCSVSFTVLSCVNGKIKSLSFASPRSGSHFNASSEIGR